MTNNSPVQIKIKGDRPAQVYQSRGFNFIEGRDGSEFTIEIKNNTGGRVKAVISVDGLNVINGTPAVQDGDGYVIGAYRTISIPGWKLNNCQAAKFTFSGKKKSYSQLTTGNTANCGVIGVVIWNEQVTAPPINYHAQLPDPWIRKLGQYEVDPNRSMFIGGMLNDVTAQSFSGSIVNSSTKGISSNLGTGFGKPTEFSTSEVDFIPSTVSKPSRHVIYYDDASGLKNYGIIVNQTRDPYQFTPDPFPGTSCSPPAGWNNS